MRVRRSACPAGLELANTMERAGLECGLTLAEVAAAVRAARECYYAASPGSDEEERALREWMRREELSRDVPVDDDGPSPPT